MLFDILPLAAIRPREAHFAWQKGVASGDHIRSLPKIIIEPAAKHTITLAQLQLMGERRNEESCGASQARILEAVTRRALIATA